MSIQEKLRRKWLGERGFLAPGATKNISNSARDREENRQTLKKPFRKTGFRMGDRPEYRQHKGVKTTPAYQRRKAALIDKLGLGRDHV